MVTVAATARPLVAPYVQAIAGLGVQSIEVFTPSPEHEAAPSHQGYGRKNCGIGRWQNSPNPHHHTLLLQGSPPRPRSADLPSSELALPHNRTRLPIELPAFVLRPAPRAMARRVACGCSTYP